MTVCVAEPLRDGDARAAAVRQVLIEDGVEPGRLDAVGFGQTQPLDTNATVAGREANRRVEFVITGGQPKTEIAPATDAPPQAPGYGDVASFCRLFAKTTGMTPGEFRRERPLPPSADASSRRTSLPTRRSRGPLTRKSLWRSGRASRRKTVAEAKKRGLAFLGYSIPWSTRTGPIEPRSSVSSSRAWHRSDEPRVAQGSGMANRPAEPGQFRLAYRWICDNCCGVVGDGSLPEPDLKVIVPEARTWEQLTCGEAAAARVMNE